MRVSMKNVEIAQGHIFWNNAIRKQSQHLFDGVEPTYLTTGNVSNYNGTSRNGHNICDTHLYQMPFGKLFLECLTLPQNFWSSLNIKSNVKCCGCNKTHRALGQLKAKQSVEENRRSVSVPILKDFGLHCSIKTALMSYYAEILGMYYFGYITDKLEAQQAINIALLNGTAYLEYCDEMRDFLMKKRATKPEPPQTKPFSIVPCLTIEERERYWFSFNYESLLGQLFTRFGECYRVEKIVPVGVGKINCFQCLHIASGENEETTFSWDTLHDWIAKSNSNNAGANKLETLPSPRHSSRTARNTATPSQKKRTRNCMRREQQRCKPKKKNTVPSYKRLFRANKTRVRRVKEDSESEVEYDEVEHDESEEFNSADDSEESEDNNCYESDDSEDEDDTHSATRKTIRRTTSIHHAPKQRSKRSTRSIINYTDVDSEDEYDRDENIEDDSVNAQRCQTPATELNNDRTTVSVSPQTNVAPTREQRCIEGRGNQPNTWEHLPNHSMTELTHKLDTMLNTLYTLPEESRIHAIKYLMRDL